MWWGWNMQATNTSCYKEKKMEIRDWETCKTIFVQSVIAKNSVLLQFFKKFIHLCCQVTHMFLTISLIFRFTVFVIFYKFWQETHTHINKIKWRIWKKNSGHAIQFILRKLLFSVLEQQQLASSKNQTIELTWIWYNGKKNGQTALCANSDKCFCCLYDILLFVICNE